MKQVYSSCVPLVKAGQDVAIQVTQTYDGTHLQEVGANQVHVSIDGPQTFLLADMIAGVYPAPGSDQSPDDYLPHVALARRTLPWERQGPNGGADTPWLALLLFKESELRAPDQVKKQVPTTGVQKLKVVDIPDVATRTRLLTTLHIPGTTDVNTLTVANAVLRRVMPTQTELTLLCHMKRATVGGADVDTAIVVGNRLPDASAPVGEKPELHTAVLVSLEQAPASMFALPPSGSTTLLVLHHWTFRPSQGGDFEQVIKSVAYRPHGGVLRFGNLPADVAPGETAPLSGGFAAIVDKDGFFITGVAHDEDVNATYRSPLHPFGPQLRTKTGFAIAAAPSEFQNAQPGTPLDFSWAAAFELGRLLALNDPAILEDLRDVHGTMKPMEPPVEANPLPPALQKPDWVVNPAWTTQPWEMSPGQSLMKDETRFHSQGVGDITGVVDHLGQWGLVNVVNQIGTLGVTVQTTVVSLDVASVTSDALDAQFADVAQAAKV